MKKRALLFSVALFAVMFLVASCSQQSSCPTFNGVKQPVNNKYKK